MFIVVFFWEGGGGGGSTSDFEVPRQVVHSLSTFFYVPGTDSALQFLKHFLMKVECLTAKALLLYNSADHWQLNILQEISPLLLLYPHKEIVVNSVEAVGMKWLIWQKIAKMNIRILPSITFSYMRHWNKEINCNFTISLAAKDSICSCFVVRVVVNNCVACGGWISLNCWLFDHGGQSWTSSFYLSQGKSIWRA